LIVADPCAEELTKVPGSRAILRIVDGARVRPAFAWDDELPPEGLPANRELVICELPMRGRHLAQLDETVARLHVNCIQMLPIQDSPDALNGGYGTRLFFAPDRAIGAHRWNCADSSSGATSEGFA